MEYLPLDSVRLSEDESAVVIIDQTLLPERLEYKILQTAEQIYDAIKLLCVRGAPAIGICAGYAMYVLARQITAGGYEFYSELEKYGEYLCSSRPTAVNLGAAVNKMLCAAKAAANKPKSEIIDILRRTAIKIHEDDIQMCRAISEYGLTLVKDGDGILTHCNAGSLATSRYGTGLGALILGSERGYNFHAYCDETRPLLQGARLTAFELKNAGVDVTLICDNMASLVMKQGLINAVFVGCDRVAANGDTANKIGTSGAAILARHYNIPFYVFCPSSTVDFDCKSGADIPIEYRDPEEIRSMFFAKPQAPEVKCLNPAFDVTDAELITAIVTEKGICRPPYDRSLREVLGK